MMYKYININILCITPIRILVLQIVMALKSLIKI